MAADAVLSRRAASVVPELDMPWRFAPRGTYHPLSNPTGLTSFSSAENGLVQDELETFVREKVTFPASSFLYQFSTAGGPRLPAALAAHLNDSFRPYKPLDGSEIQITGAATAMHNILGWAIGDPGEAILTSTPVYGRFELDFGNLAQLQMVYAAADEKTGFQEGVVDLFETRLREASEEGTKVRAVLIVNPHNPLGRCYPRRVLVAIMRFCQRHRLHLISDEVYGCSVFGPSSGSSPPTPSLPGFTSALSIDPAGILDEDRLHVTYGLSKDFGIAGLRVGAVVTRSRLVHGAVKSVMRFFNPSGASVAIATAMLEDREWCRGFLKVSNERVGAAYRHVTEGLSKLGITFLPANAGFFIYVDLSPYLHPEAQDPEFELAQRLLDAGIFLHPKEEHGQPGWFRVVYTQPPEVVSEGLRRLAKALHITI